MEDSVVLLGQKVGQSDGLAMDSQGILYFGDLLSNSVYTWNSSLPLTAANQVQLAHNNVLMQWADTFAFDAKRGNLLLVTNRLQLFPSSYDWTGNSGFNFHILSFALNVQSYMDA